MNKAMGVSVYDGVTGKSRSLDAFDSWLDGVAQRRGNSNTETVGGIYSAVAWVYRCVTIRANAWMAVPYEIRQGDRVLAPEEGDELPYPAVEWPWLLWRTSAARDLYGASYWYEDDDFLRWLNPLTTKPVIHQRMGITGFRSSDLNRIIPETEIVYLPLWHPEHEWVPGLSPAQNALHYAGLAVNANDLVSTWFSQGAHMSVILTTDQGIDDTELERIESTWRKVYSGIKKAFQTVVLRRGLKPMVIGQRTKDLAMPELLDKVKEQISVAFGVPLSLLDTSAANFATAKEDNTNFYTKTIFPDLRLVQEAMNRQLWTPLGYEWEFKFDEVEAVQQDEAKKAEGISQLLAEATTQYDSGVISLEQAQRLSVNLWLTMGDDFDISDLPAPEEPEEPEPVMVTPGDEMAEEPAVAPEMLEQQRLLQAAAQRAMREDLFKWRRKVKGRGIEAAFETKAIPPWAQAIIKARLKRNPETAFRPFLKQASLQEAGERAMRRAIAAIFARYRDTVNAALAAGQMPDLTEMYREIRSAVEPIYVEMIGDETIAQGAEIGWGMDDDELNAEAQEYASAAAKLLSERMQNSRAGQIQKALNQIAAGEITVEAAQTIIGRLFSDTQAETAAETEITAALHQASVRLSDDLDKAGIDNTIRWLTQEDEKVCAICGPLDQTPEDVWSETHPDGPPAHPKCRCRTTVEVMR